MTSTSSNLSCYTYYLPKDICLKGSKASLNNSSSSSWKALCYFFSKFQNIYNWVYTT